MDRIRDLLLSRDKQAREDQEYEPLTNDGEEEQGAHSTPGRDIDASSVGDGELEHETPFSWAEYLIFAVLGVAMLWAWNMFLAAAPYFQSRFQSDPWLRSNFQSAILSTSTFTNLASMSILTNIQAAASYPFRINTSLVMNVVIFGLLTASTSLFLDVSPGVYAAFLLATVALSSWATGMMQNGAFAFAASFGRPEYMQAIMAGQGVAGVLPPIAQMVSVLAFPPDSPADGRRPGTAAAVDGAQSQSEGQSGPKAGTAAFIYFLAAVTVSLAALVLFAPLVRRHNRLVEARMSDQMAASHATIEQAERAARRVVGPLTLLRKLHFICGSVFICFVVTMFFPVFTSKIVSVRTPLSVDTAAGSGGDSGSGDGTNPIFQPAAFIPLGFFFWNLGDLAGRVSTMFPLSASLRRRPVALFSFAVARLLFLPLYMLCNIGGRGAVVSSDLFYLLLVQLPFGLTNGFLGSSAMMAAGEWVAEAEREAAGGFMGLCLVAGLSVGSLLSFTASGI